MTSRIGLVACCGQKLLGASAAQDLYVSTLFTKSRAWVELNCDSWFILSAKYGVVAPLEVIEPYEVTLNTQSRAAREVWGYRVFEQLAKLQLVNAQFIALAGTKYVDPLKDLITLEQPMKGLGIGEQLHWLTEQLLQVA